jgi:hypothetical protein
MDDDLQSLLNQLDIDGSDVDVTPPASNKPSDEKVENEVEQTSPEKPNDQATVTSITVDTPTTTGVSEVQEVADTDVVNHTKKYLTKLDDVTDEILTACRSDRQEAQEVIILYKSQIEDALTSNRDPQRMYVDGLVQAVEVKSNINLTMVKIMEANAKMLASLKAGSSLNIKNNINVASSNDKELENILDEPITEIDDY